MSEFKFILNDVLVEKGKTFEDLENAGVICPRSFYQYNTYTPYLNTVIKIANYLEVSLDYLIGRTSVNSFKKYNENQPNFCNNLLKIMSYSHITQTNFTEDLQLGRTNFVYWRKGRLPKLSTLIAIANYLHCNIDDLLDRV